MKISFIGAGNMGGAIIGGIIKAGIAAPSEVKVADKSEARLSEIKDNYGVAVTVNNKECLDADILMLCVKLGVIYRVIKEIAADIKPETVVVSIAAGQSLEKLADEFGKPGVKLARVMPNTPALVGEGMAAVSVNDNISDEETQAVLEIFNCLGRAELVPQSLMDTVTAVSGSSPAYVFMFIEALADAAVRGGMSRDMAYAFAAQSVMGSAKMVLDTKKHPAELKDMVCSPGGTTIDAVAVLEEEGMRSAVMKAVKVCIDKSKAL